MWHGKISWARIVPKTCVSLLLRVQVHVVCSVEKYIEKRCWGAFPFSRTCKWPTWFFWTAPCSLDFLGTIPGQRGQTDSHCRIATSLNPTDTCMSLSCLLWSNLIKNKWIWQLGDKSSSVEFNFGSWEECLLFRKQKWLGVRRTEPRLGKERVSRFPLNYISDLIRLSGKKTWKKEKNFSCEPYRVCHFTDGVEFVLWQNWTPSLGRFRGFAFALTCPLWLEVPEKARL